MQFLLLIAVALALAVGCGCAWLLVRRWNDPPATWAESLAAYGMFAALPPLTVWRFALVSGILGGLAGLAVGGVMVVAG